MSIETWTTARGEVLPLHMLTDGHLNNCLSMLEKNAKSRLRMLGKNEDEWEKVVDEKFWPLRAEAARRTAKVKIEPKPQKSWWQRLFS